MHLLITILATWFMTTNTGTHIILIKDTEENGVSYFNHMYLDLGYGHSNNWIFLLQI